MTVNIFELLGWSAFLSYLVLVAWWLVFVFAHAWFYQLNQEWFNLSESEFDNIHYFCMGLFKLAIILFFLIPFIAYKILS